MDYFTSVTSAVTSNPNNMRLGLFVVLVAIVLIVGIVEKDKIHTTDPAPDFTTSNASAMNIVNIVHMVGVAGILLLVSSPWWATVDPNRYALVVLAVVVFLYHGSRVLMRSGVF